MHISQNVDFSTTSHTLHSSLKSADLLSLAAVLRELDPIEIIEHFDSFSLPEAAVAFRLLDKSRALKVFENLDAPLQASLIQGLRHHEVVDVFAGIGAAERVALLDELPAAVASSLLKTLDATNGHETSVILGYPATSIGRFVSPHFVTTYPELSAAQSIERFRAKSTERAATDRVLVIDHDRRLLGAVQLGELIAAEPQRLIGELLGSVFSASVTDPAVQTARHMVNRHQELGAIVDSEHRLVGVLHWTQATQILEDAEETRSARTSGAEPLSRPYLSTPIGAMVRSRILWLLVLAIGATLTVQVLSSFEETLESMVVLSLFIPLIVGIGGNTGNQAATTVTRALAMGEVRSRDIGKVLLREIRVGLVLGLSLGSLGFLLTAAIFEIQIAWVIGLTLIALCTIAASVGGIMPIIGQTFKADPAVFSNPFISTFVDAAGLIVYLSIAMLILG
ncbi:magnesium transporter [Glutamicibacter sp. NPDC087344]|uniref:magnesium transporter n=1 Tax=Glutamicibacter sp. NPDC087344 TaxID=3363994 RepID=UPI003806DAA2